jgi:Zn-dependent oligopeptidase
LIILVQEEQYNAKMAHSIPAMSWLALMVSIVLFVMRCGHMTVSDSNLVSETEKNCRLTDVWPALFDLAIHTPPTHAAALDMDTTEIWNATKQRIITTSCGHDPRDWGAGQARFIHIFRHNDAGYFSYPLSMAYAADLFAATFAEDPMSAAAGRR